MTNVKGIVIRWFPDRGYGFSEFEDGREVFCHATDAGGLNLTEGDRIEAEIIDLKKGPRAVRILLTSGQD